MVRPLWQIGRQILHGMNRELDFACQQGLFDFLGEKALAADFIQRAVLDAVSRGRNRDNFDVGGVQAMGGNQAVAGFAGLDKGEGRPPGSNLNSRHLQVISGGC